MQSTVPSKNGFLFFPKEKTDMYFMSVLKEENSLPSIDVSPEFSTPNFGFDGVDIPAWLMILVLLAVIAIIVVPIMVYSIVRSKKTNEKFVFSTKDLVYGAVCLAMSYVLSFIGLSLNLGGTITFASILPVTVYCYYFGYRKGAIICAAYILLQLTQNPFIVSPWSMLLDYVIPYFALGFSGMFAYNPSKHKKATGSKRFALMSHRGYYIGLAIYIVIRYTSHILSGVIFWDLWYGPAPLGYVIGFSFGYNSFCLIDWAIAVASSLALLSSKTFDKLMIDVSADGRNACAASNSDGKKSSDGSMASQADGLAHTDPGTEDHK